MTFMHFWTARVHVKKWMSRPLLKIVAAEKSWLNKEPLKGGELSEFSENWSRWKIGAILSDIETKSMAYQMVMFKHCTGNKGIHILRMLNWKENEDANNVPCKVGNLLLQANRRFIWVLQTSSAATLTKRILRLVCNCTVWYYSHMNNCARIVKKASSEIVSLLIFGRMNRQRKFRRHGVSRYKNASTSSESRS